MRKSWMIIALAAATVAGCEREEAAPGDQMTGDMTSEEIRQARAGWPEGLGELVDSANAAYAAGDYEAAAALFRRSTEVAPNVTATWFGVYMTEHARGNIAAADSAMARAQELSPGASLIHEDGGMPPAQPVPGATLPPSHPDTSAGQ